MSRNRGNRVMESRGCHKSHMTGIRKTNRERMRADGTLPGDPSGTRSLRRLCVAHSPTTRRLPAQPLAPSRRQSSAPLRQPAAIRH